MGGYFVNCRKKIAKQLRATLLCIAEGRPFEETRALAEDCGGGSLLRGVYLVEITARFGGRVTAGDGLINVARRHVIDDIRGLNLIAGEAPAARCQRRRYRR